MRTKTFNVEQILERLRDGGSIENDEEAHLLTKRRQALWTESPRLKDSAPQENSAQIAASLELITTSLTQWRNRSEDEADVMIKRRQALWTERSRLKDKDAQERLAQIAGSIKTINERLKQLRRG